MPDKRSSLGSNPKGALRGFCGNLTRMAPTGQPNVRFRPKGEAWLRVYKGDRQLELALDSDGVDLPPQWDPRRQKPPVRARIVRQHGGHRLVPSINTSARVNGRVVEKQHLLRGGDEVEFEGFHAVYTTAREELPWPMTLVVWPPEGPPLEIRTHRTRLEIGCGDSDVIVDDATLDQLHCIVKRFRNGIMQIEDNGSYNGIYVDGRKVVDGMRIRDGAEIRIGNTRMKAWTEAPDVPDLSTMPVQDQFDGLPDDGFNPDEAEPLRPYAVELGPDYVHSRRRTFADDVPTKVESGGESVDVRPRRRPADREFYDDKNDPAGAERMPDWAPLDANSPKRRTNDQKRGKFKESETGSDWANRDKGGLTLHHKNDREIKPRTGQ